MFTGNKVLQFFYEIKLFQIYDYKKINCVTCKICVYKYLHTRSIKIHI